MNVEEASEAELRAVFGPRADYYVAQWQGTARRASNWAAFWFSGAWLPFRRLYSAALIFYAAIAVESVLEEIVFRWIGYGEVPTAVSRAVALACATVCGVPSMMSPLAPFEKGCPLHQFSADCISA